MKPTAFPQHNGTLGGGPGSHYGTEGEVIDLPVYRGDGQIISCWKLSWRERLRLFLGGSVWLHVLATRTHVPVTLTTENPWDPPKKAT